MARNNEGYTTVPADYAIDGLALEVDRRRKKMGRPYSYGQLVADTTREEWAEIAEGYRAALSKAIRRGRRRVSVGGAARLESREEAEERIAGRRRREAESSVDS